MSIKNFLLPVVIIAICIGAIALTPSPIESIEKIYTRQVKYPSVFPLTEEDKLWIENKINMMSIREKCAQLIVPAVYRNDFDVYSSGYSRISALVKDEKIGGLILFQGGLEEEINFINDMQELADIPLLIASDFERGLGTRIDDALEFPHAMAIGSTFNPDYAYEVGKVTAIQSRQIGVHQTFAPVADINNNPMNPVINIRSFSEKKEDVIKFVNAFIKGSKETRFITTAKHFPGHGNTEIDSHYDLPKINGSYEHLKTNELGPFIEAIRSGVQSIMVGHLEVPAFEPIKGIPASLSKSIVTYLLKEELGFDGLIVTDAMNMEAITKYYSEEAAAVMAIEAGCDIILMTPDELKAIDALVTAVNNGKIVLERLDESVRKILAAKRWLKIDEQKPPTLPALYGRDYKTSYSLLAKRIAEQSITMLKNDQNLIPFKQGKFKNIYCITLTDKNWSEQTEYFENILENRVGRITTYFFTDKTKKNEYKRVLQELTDADLIIIPSFIDVKTYQRPVNLSAEQIDFIAGIMRKNIPSILISFRNPYLIYLFPEAETYLNSYSYSYQSQDAMLKALLGENEINGRLPVTIPDSDLEYGSGIVLEKSLNTTIGYSLISNNLTNSIDEKINLSLTQNLFPGAVVLAAKDGKIFYNRAFGKSGVEDNSYIIEKDEIFNVSKLSNLFTTASALKLADEGLVQVDDELFIFFDGFFNPDKRKIKIKDLITHSSGLGTNIPGIKTYWDKDDLITNILNQELSYLPGSGTQYTIQNIILLREIIEMKSGEKLSTYFEHKFQKPLEIFNSGFSDLRKDYISIHYGSPPPDMVTVKTQEDFIDEIFTADSGHTSGFSGFYSNASELAVFSQMLLQNGYYGETQIMNASKVDNWFNEFRETEKMNTGSKEIEIIDPRGCSININKDNNSFIIILTNAGIRNPSNKSFVDFSEKLIQFFNEEISRGIL